MEYQLGVLKNDKDGYTQLIALYNQITSNPANEITIRLPNWFEANMCAPFGAILNLCRNHGIKKITLNCDYPDVMEILQKNKFLSTFGFNIAPVYDKSGTTIQYRDFRQGDHVSFSLYVDSNFKQNQKGFPEMNEQLLINFRRSLFEIFENAVTHSETSTIYACGQHFRKKKRLNFSIVDVGIGFHGNINKKIGSNFSPIKAILWALEENTTTKNGPVPGGLGLKLIKEFIHANEGRMHVISYSGYCEYFNGIYHKETLQDPFPGTIVNIQINTAEKFSYRLKSEVDEDGFFR
jgi:hypothetical protein